MGNQAIQRLHEATARGTASAGEGDRAAERDATRAARATVHDRAAGPPPSDVDDERPSTSTRRSAERTARQARSRLGTGAPLPAHARSYFERRYGHDFGDVRVHTDRRADAAARSHDAIAFTVGTDVAFRDGAYGPHTREGRALLAHELAHVVQQSGGGAVLQRREDEEDDDPETLDDVDAETRRRLRVYTKTVDPNEFQIPRVSEGRSTRGDTEIVYGSGVSEGELGYALQNVAFELIGSDKAPMPENSTVTLAFDVEGIERFEEVSPKRFVVRFTYYRDPGADEKTLLLERLGPASTEAEQESAEAESEATEAELESAEAESEATEAESEATEAESEATEAGSGGGLDSILARYDFELESGSNWPGSMRSLLEEGLESVPDGHLSELDGLTFEVAPIAAEGKRAEYDPGEHTISLDPSLGDEEAMNRFGTEPGAFVSPGVRSVTHEIGHALDLTERAELFRLQRAYKAATKRRDEIEDALEESEDDSGIEDALEESGDDILPPSPLDDIDDPGDEEYDKDDLEAAREEAEQARQSVQEYQETDPEPRFRDDEGFERALRQDDPEDRESEVPLTGYLADILEAKAERDGEETEADSEKDEEVDLADLSYEGEAFAEHYSLYLTDPETLEALRPAVYAYFEEEFGDGD